MVDLAAPISFPCTACPRNKKHGIGICCYNLGNIKECKQGKAKKSFELNLHHTFIFFILR
ncbi:hypothetical protein JHK82_024271 [Glycine max]|uniref:Uncharacterized protein n=1 Tax=Glycine soja TaxID=3848 RepID=A0A0B2PX91_GLYSO|nr:hypothetical protein JHK87_024237 [Glycine soja]KAG5006308.1 hypothetical protein JHK85_024850 [Glycine max]KAG5012102.1 hypothetical protein JHK86_024363 [Glycine max]KAG5133083.1 hypothetical protein JHK82_024271 [Glycine max]KHN12304.1 hypothetical protein glysoja_026196 [Glycine soja]